MFLIKAHRVFPEIQDNSIAILIRFYNRCAFHLLSGKIHFPPQYNIVLHSPLILRFRLYNRKKDEVPAEVTALVEKRAAAKKAKDWATADAIRAQLTELGWAVKDTAQGPQLSKL